MSEWIKRMYKKGNKFFDSHLKSLDFKGGNFLDVGCNAGYYSFAALRLKNNVVGIDTGQECIDYANNKRKKYSKKKQENIEFFCGKLSDFEPDTKFDYIFCNNLVNSHNYEEIIMEIAGLLEDDGVIFFGAIPDIGFGILKPGRKAKRALDMDALKAELEKYDLEIVEDFQDDWMEVFHNTQWYDCLDDIKYLNEIAGKRVLYSVIIQRK
jgi:2-polyprenyl-3-methyl-5-hydroxy-6-metoxy-1,4-benzoquinol methylase